MRNFILYAGMVFLCCSSGTVLSQDAVVSEVEELQEDELDEIYRSPDERMLRDPSEVLLEFFDRNELAMAHYRLCVNNGLYPPEEFMRNTSYVTLKLQEALERSYLDKTAEEIEKYIVQRGSYLQRKNSQRAYDYGCDAPWAMEAKEHFDFMIQLREDVLASYVRRLVGNVSED